MTTYSVSRITKVHYKAFAIGLLTAVAVLHLLENRYICLNVDQFPHNMS